MTMYHIFFTCGWTPRLKPYSGYCEQCYNHGNVKLRHLLIYQSPINSTGGTTLTLFSRMALLIVQPTVCKSSLPPFLHFCQHSNYSHSFCLVWDVLSHYLLLVCSNFLSVSFNFGIGIHKVYSLRGLPFSWHRVVYKQLSLILCISVVSIIISHLVSDFESFLINLMTYQFNLYTCFHKLAVHLNFYIVFLGSNLFLSDLVLVMSSLIIYSCFGRYLSVPSSYDSFFNVGIFCYELLSEHYLSCGPGYAVFPAS